MGGLNDQLDQFEADVELMSNKKSMGNDDKSKLAQFKTLQERHQWHINKLELILRAVDNDALDLTDLAVVRESVVERPTLVVLCEIDHNESLASGARKSQH